LGIGDWGFGGLGWGVGGGGATTHPTTQPQKTTQKKLNI